MGVPSYQPETEDAHSYEYSTLEENAIYYLLDYGWDEFSVHFGVLKSLRYFSCLLRCFSF